MIAKEDELDLLALLSEAVQEQMPKLHHFMPGNEDIWVNMLNSDFIPSLKVIIPTARPFISVRAKKRASVDIGRVDLSISFPGDEDDSNEISVDHPKSCISQKNENRPKKTVTFGKAEVYYFHFAQGFSTVPLDKSVSIGMEMAHFASFSESLNNPAEIFDKTSVISNGERAEKVKVGDGIVDLRRIHILRSAGVELVPDMATSLIAASREKAGKCDCGFVCDNECPCYTEGFGCVQNQCKCCRLDVTDWIACDSADYNWKRFLVQHTHHETTMILCREEYNQDDDTVPAKVPKLE